jgi:hypothetical protein
MTARTTTQRNDDGSDHVETLGVLLVAFAFELMSLLSRCAAFPLGLHQAILWKSSKSRREIWTGPNAMAVLAIRRCKCRQICQIT